jgi:transposase-like protein
MPSPEILAPAPPPAEPDLSQYAPHPGDSPELARWRREWGAKRAPKASPSSTEGTSTASPPESSQVDQLLAENASLRKELQKLKQQELRQNKKKASSGSVKNDEPSSG